MYLSIALPKNQSEASDYAFLNPKYYLIGDPSVGLVQTIFKNKSAYDSCPQKILTLKISLYSSTVNYEKHFRQNFSTISGRKNNKQYM